MKERGRCRADWMAESQKSKQSVIGDVVISLSQAGCRAAVVGWREGLNFKFSG